jgi:hypothetical protein
MSTIEELEAKVKSLNPQELAEFREWFQRFEDEVWDRKIREDQANGKIDETQVINGTRQNSCDLISKTKG